MTPIPYRHIFAINKALLKRNIPEDLIPTILEFVGDPTETREDLCNKFAFYEIVIDFKRCENCLFGYYCNVCEKVYLLESPCEFRKHINASFHKKKLIDYSEEAPKEEKIHAAVFRKRPEKLYWRIMKTKKKEDSISIQPTILDLQY